VVTHSGSTKKTKKKAVASHATVQNVHASMFNKVVESFIENLNKLYVTIGDFENIVALDQLTAIQVKFSCLNFGSGKTDDSLSQMDLAQDEIREKMQQSYLTSFASLQIAVNSKLEYFKLLKM
jgi:hypothetical protein